jgi:hypothetical protein
MSTADRLNLWDMKLMVEEGAQMFDDDEENERAGRATTQMRELSKAQSVVEIAEEWLARIRDLINSDVDENGNIIQSDDEDEKPTRMVEADVAGKVTGEDADEGTRDSASENGNKSDNAVNMRELLREMLKEAEGMPVQMDEVQVLRVHLQALDWAEKVRSILPVPSAFATTLQENHRAIMAAANSPDGAAGRDFDPSVRVSPTQLGIFDGNDTEKPAFARVVELAAEVKKYV